MFLSAASSAQYQSLQQNLPHAVILTGQRGVGLFTISRHLAGTEIAAILEPTNSKDEIDHAVGTIKIEAIRKLYEDTRGKTSGRQIVIIDDAETMTTGAQNAFLKLLEEPHEGLHFILTSHRPEKLLPTIRSRAQSYTFTPLDASHDEEMVKAFDLADKKPQALFIASGLPAELARLGQDSEYFEARSSEFRWAREFLTASAYHKIIMAQAVKDRTDALTKLDAALSIARRSYYQQADALAARRIETLLHAHERIASNGNIKAQLLAAVV